MQMYYNCTAVDLVREIDIYPGYLHNHVHQQTEFSWFRHSPRYLTLVPAHKNRVFFEGYTFRQI